MAIPDAYAHCVVMPAADRIKNKMTKYVLSYGLCEVHHLNSRTQAMFGTSRVGPLLILCLLGPIIKKELVYHPRPPPLFPPASKKFYLKIFHHPSCIKHATGLSIDVLAHASTCQCHASSYIVCMCSVVVRKTSSRPCHKRQQQ
jgi:hypothetical protein